ncbi:hypothetical protein GmHk_04G010746 [Glycine max]|nr:hypothetical protein GmHk_04G010746 [Glycine max]
MIQKFDDDDSYEEDDELSLITRKIRKMWKNKNSSRSKRSFHKKEKKTKHFKLECSNLEKPKDKKKFFKPKKKSLMSTWEDLDDSSSDEDSEEEANLCLMADVSTSKADPTLDTSSNDEDSQPDDNVNSGKEVVFKSKEELIKGYNTLLFVSARVSKAYRKLNKCFQHLEKEHEDLKKAHEVHLVDLSWKPLHLEVKALLDEKVSNGRKTLLKDFQDLEERVKFLTTTLEDSTEGRKEILKQKLLLKK